MKFNHIPLQSFAGFDVTNGPDSSSLQVRLFNFVVFHLFDRATEDASKNWAVDHGLGVWVHGEWMVRTRAVVSSVDVFPHNSESYALIRFHVLVCGHSSQESCWGKGLVGLQHI